MSPMALAPFTEIARANLLHWQERVQSTPVTGLPALAPHMPNLQRAVAYGLRLVDCQHEALGLMLQLAPLIDARADWFDWIDAFEAAGRLAEASRHPLAAALHNRLGSFYKATQKYDQAAGMHAAALEFALASDDLPEETNALLGISEIEHFRHHYDEAEKLAERALVICRRAGLVDTRRAAAHNLLGMIAHNRGSYAAAEAHYLRALEIWGSLDSRRHYAYALSNLSLTLQSLGRLDEARRVLMEAIPLFEESGAWLSVVNGRLSLGTIHFLRQDYPAALQSFSAIDWLKLERQGYDEPLAWTTNNLGNAHLKLGNTTEAAEHLAYSATLWRALGNEVALGNTLGTLAEALAGAGQREPALHHLDEAIALLEKHPQNAWASDRLRRLIAQREALKQPDD